MRFQAENIACARRAIGLVVHSREMARYDVTVAGRSCCNKQRIKISSLLLKNVFSQDNRVRIKVLRQDKGYNIRTLP